MIKDKTAQDFLEEEIREPAFKSGHRKWASIETTRIIQMMDRHANYRVSKYAKDQNKYSKEHLRKAYRAGKRWFSGAFEDWFKRVFS